MVLSVGGWLRDDDRSRAIGEVLLNDPPDYAEHVALGEIEKIGPEFVLACRQVGRMLPDRDAANEALAQWLGGQLGRGCRG